MLLNCSNLSSSKILPGSLLEKADESRVALVEVRMGGWSFLWLARGQLVEGIFCFSAVQHPYHHAISTQGFRLGGLPVSLFLLSKVIVTVF